MKKTGIRECLTNVLDLTVSCCHFSSSSEVTNVRTISNQDHFHYNKDTQINSNLDTLNSQDPFLVIRFILNHNNQVMDSRDQGIPNQYLSCLVMANLIINNKDNIPVKAWVE
jgi:hypothetical protein